VFSPASRAALTKRLGEVAARRRRRAAARRRCETSRTARCGVAASATLVAAWGRKEGNMALNRHLYSYAPGILRCLAAYTACCGSRACILLRTFSSAMRCTFSGQAVSTICVLRALPHFAAISGRTAIKRRQAKARCDGGGRRPRSVTIGGRWWLYGLARDGSGAG